MQQQSFTPIQKTEPKKIVVDEGQDGPRDNIENTVLDGDLRFLNRT